MPAGWISAGVGAIGLVNSLSNSGGSSSNGYGSGVPYYTPQWQSGADQQWQSLMQQAGNSTKNLSSTVDPAMLSSLYKSLGLNYGGLESAANTAGSQAGSIGTMDYNSGANLMQGANGILNMAFDPQNALYNKTAQTLTDQTRAGEAARGLGNSPVGASIEGQALGDFNLNWQNNQLQRAESGVGAAGTAYGQGATVAGMAPGMTYNSGALPLQAYQTAAAAPGQAANTYSTELAQSLAPLLNQYQGLSQYLNYGQGQANGASGAFNTQQNFNAGQQSSAVQGLLTGLGNTNSNGPGSWLNSLFSGGGGGGGGGWSNPWGSGTSTPASDPTYGANNFVP